MLVVSRNDLDLASNDNVTFFQNDTQYFSKTENGVHERGYDKFYRLKNQAFHSSFDRLKRIFQRMNFKEGLKKKLRLEKILIPKVLVRLLKSGKKMPHKVAVEKYVAKTCKTPLLFGFGYRKLK